MLVIAKAIEEKNERKLPSSEKELISLPEETLRQLTELFNQIERDVIEPFFKITDLESLDSNWDKWVKWANPLLSSLNEKTLYLFSKPEVLQRVITTLEEFSSEVRVSIRNLSEPLGETLERSIQLGIQADLLMLSNIHRLNSIESAPDELLSQRKRGASGFGLAFLLLVSYFQRVTEDDIGRLRFIVLKMKRMAALAHMSSLSILSLLPKNKP